MTRTAPRPTARPTRTLRFAAAVLSAVLGATMAAGALAAPAWADTAEDPAPVRWSVTPADVNGPDGRRAVENTLDPGESVSDQFAVRNLSANAVEFSLDAGDGFYTRAGRFDMLTSDKESVDAGTWIDVPDTVTVPAGETVIVPFTIDVPEQAEPGDHAAGITASILSIQDAEDGTSVGVQSRVGFRVSTRVTGELAPKADLRAVAGNYALSWNPIRPGVATVTFDVENLGNTALLATGTVVAGGQSVAFPDEGVSPQQLLPGDTRTVTVVVDGVWPTLIVPVTTTLAATVVTMGGDESALPPIARDATVVAMPWPQLILVAGLALVLWAILAGRLRSRRKIAAIVADAREQGRRDAADGGV